MSDKQDPVINHEQMLTIEYQKLLLNYYTSRLNRYADGIDPRRNIEKECGHPIGEISPTQYFDMYDFYPIPGRVVEIFPKQCYQIVPDIYEDNNPKKETPFEKDWSNLQANLSPFKNYFKGPKTNMIWEVMKRADELSGVGRYGIIFLGLDDNLDPETPATPRIGQKLLYLRVFPERNVLITQWDQNVNSNRYGMPIMYQITFNNPATLNSTTEESETKDVHYTRVVHIADNLQSSEVYGTPRQKPVFNNLLDLKKLYGGSAEMYWKGAFPGIGFEALPEALRGGPAKMDLNAMRSDIENFMNGLQRYYAISGATAKTLAPQVVDPTPQIQAHIEAICIKGGYPKRVFMGSERGELSSGQDDASWNDILRERQQNNISPRQISPFINHLIWLKVLSEPTTYNIDWPDLTSQTPQEKSHVAFERSQSLAQYANSRAPEVIGPLAFLTEIIGFTEQTAIAILKASDLRLPEPKVTVPVANPVNKNGVTKKPNNDVKAGT